jgi:cellulose biosynthesis protein BcsQ
MKKIHLVIGDEDTKYIELFANYIRATEHAGKFSIKLFSQKENMEQYLETQSHINVLLATPAMLPDDIRSISSSVSAGSVIKLEDDRLSSVEVDLPSVYKYQPLNKLISEILAIYYDEHGKQTSLLGKDQQSQVVAIYSATGGTGKTTFAVNLCRQIALQGASVFYLNLELMNSTPMFFAGDEESDVSSQVLYYAKANPKQLVSKIESLKKHDAYSKIDYFDLAVNAEEMLDLSEQDVEQLIDGLINTENYNYIVIDLDDAFDDRVKAALKSSSRIFWLLNNDLQSFHKTAYLLQQIDQLLEYSVSDQVHLTLNRHTGQLAEGLSAYGLSVRGYLPYIPEWKNVHDSDQLTSSPVFDEEVLKLFSEVFAPNRGVPID